MQVVIKYHDSDSFTAEEVVKLAQHNYGKSAKVQVFADSPAPHDQIYFALQQIVTYEQLSLLYDRKETYQSDIRALRAKVLADVAELLDSVIIDNETKVQ